jgi:hypothetical protein
MAWTTPRTWYAGEIVTAALMNTHLRDNLNILKTNIDDDGNITGANICLHTDVTPVTKSGNAAHEMMTYEIPGGTVYEAGDFVRLQTLFETASPSSFTLIGKFYLGSDSITCIAQTGAGNSWRYLVDVHIMLLGSASSILSSLCHLASAAAPATLYHTLEKGTSTEDMTGNVTAKFEATISSYASGSLTQLWLKIDKVKV